ncbi:hypothetical protein JWG42_13080 [Desulfoprunum benzoelyticum]|uniref:Uncharacterized protein n=1 Tax=Desulfoprunum benzoelyticum TaxID=1506996 RepID=A0A840URZ6_9BACT|nr:hypothetical protein [Desulfoprunum benzoelyticum]MBB5347596.1 hypothetical protein [Desulfoprunum benzoelyticum]MBM9531086.1 hypothetical protein [Desulfoprunum benzoelyticum]
MGNYNNCFIEDKAKYSRSFSDGLQVLTSMMMCINKLNGLFPIAARLDKRWRPPSRAI